MESSSFREQLARDLDRSVGIDLVEEAAFAHSTRLTLQENFDDEELNHAETRVNPSASLAGMWAAKEAFFKALGTGLHAGLHGPHEVLVRHDEVGAPHLYLSPELEQRLGVEASRIHLSIAHNDGMAAAVVVLPAQTRPLPSSSPMGKTGGIKNYEKSRSDLLSLLRGLRSAEAPPPPRLDASPEALSLVDSWSTDPEIGPVLALARRCGLELRLASVHPAAWENLDNAEESNDFRKLAPYAQLHFLALTLDSEACASLPEAPPLHEQRRGAVLLNRGLFEGPEGLEDARALLLRSELLHEAVHFEDPSFHPEEPALLGEWYEEAAGIARQVLTLARAEPETRRRAEALVTDTLEENPILGSFDLDLGDGTRRRIASKTFMVLEMELAEVQRAFGTLTPDGMSTSLFRLTERLLADPTLFDPSEGRLSDAGLEEILRYTTRQDRDLRRAVVREMGVQLQEFMLPPEGAARVRAVMDHTAALLDGSITPTSPAPQALEASPIAPTPALTQPSALPLEDPAARARALRFARAPISPARSRARASTSLMLHASELDALTELGPDDELVIDLRPRRDSTQFTTNARKSALEHALRLVSQGRSLSLRLPRRLDEARDLLRLFVPALGSSLRELLFEASKAEEIARLDDELTELETLLGLPAGGIGIELCLERQALLAELRALLESSPRVSAVEIGAMLPSSLGWVFQGCEGEMPSAMADRRLREAEQVLQTPRVLVLSLAESLGIPVLRALPPLGAASEFALHRLVDPWSNLRLCTLRDHERMRSVGPDHLRARLSSLEVSVFGGEVSDPSSSFRLEEDLHVLQEAVQRGRLRGAELERYWRARWALLYDDGVPPSLPIPDLDLPRALREAAARHPERRFLYRAELQRPDGVREMIRADVPFGDILGVASNRVANILLGLGIQKGDRVAISTSNTLSNIAAFQGVALAGAVVVPLDPTKAHLADRFFNDGGVKLLFFDASGGGDDGDLHHAQLLAWAREQDLDEAPEFLSELRKARRRIAGDKSFETGEALAALLPKELRGTFLALWARKLDPSVKFAESLPRVPSLETVILLSVEDLVPNTPPAPLPPGARALELALAPRVRVLRLSSLLEQASDQDPGLLLSAEDELAWPYTGGTTTGVGKAAIHTHRSILALGLQRGISMIPPSEHNKHVVATTLPFTHTYGFATGVLTPVLTGSDALVVPSTGPRYLSIVAEALAEEGVTELFSSRSALSSLIRLIPQKTTLPHLRRIASSGDTLTLAVVEEWSARFGVSPNSGYGSTETPSSLMNPSRTNRQGTEGIPVPNVEARVVDAASGEVLPPGKAGLLQLRGPHLARAYAGKPEATAKALKPGGWWQKDDIFEMDEDGFFVFRGRADDMFTVNELNVYPETVEQALLSLPGVAEAGVIGVFDEDLQTNRVKAFVVAEPGVELKAQALLEQVRPLLEAHESPSILDVVEDLAKSNFGKLARARLREPAPRPQTVPTPQEPVLPKLPPPLVAEETLMVFPTGGSHFPGMGSEFPLEKVTSGLVERAEQALTEVGVPRGTLRRLMEGRGQAERTQLAEGFTWTGDFPLSVAAQTLVSIGLARHFEQSLGLPFAVVGESMGEAAAYAFAGALSLEDAVLLAWRQASLLAHVSDELGLRMVVVEGLDASALAGISAPFDARVVIEEARRLFVLALPAARLSAFEKAISAAGARALVSNNPCAAHDPRLLDAPDAAQALETLLEELPLRVPRLPVLSALQPGLRLTDIASLKDNLRRSFSTPLQWSATLAAATEARTLVQLGGSGGAYALERQREQGDLPVSIQIRAASTLAGVDALDALPGRCWGGAPFTVDQGFIRTLARSSGDRNSYHLDPEYARKTRYGAVILHGVGTEALALVEVARRFPAWEITRVEQPSFKVPVKVGDSVRALVELVEAQPSELEIAFFALNQWSDILLEGRAWLSPRSEPVSHPSPLNLNGWGQDVTAFAPRPAPDFELGDEQRWTYDLDEARIVATRTLFPGGQGVFSAALGLQLLSFGSASFAPGFVLTGTSLLDLRRAASELGRSLLRAGVDRARLQEAATGATSLDTLLDRLTLSGKAGKALRKSIPSSLRLAIDALLASERGRESLLQGPQAAERPIVPGTLSVRTRITSVEGLSPRRNLRISFEVSEEGAPEGRLLYLGEVTKTESPPEEPEQKSEGALEEDPAARLAARLIQQKIINVFPVTRPRDAENSAADPAVNAALIDLEDAVSPVMRREARPRAIEMISRVRRDSSSAKKTLVAALQTARSRLRSAKLQEILLDPGVRDFESLLARLDFRKKGAEEFLAAMKRPQQRLLAAYLVNEGARQALIDSLNHLDFGGKVLKLRPNNVRTTASAADYHDVIQQVGERIDALTVPKTRDPAEIVAIDRALTSIEIARGWTPGRLKLELLIEHPLAVVMVDEIAAASPRVISLIYGHVDYVAATGGWSQDRQFEYQWHAKRRTVEAAQANGQIAIDAITPAIHAESARRDALRAAAMGFHGKWSIHLDHIEGIRTVEFPAPRLRIRPHFGAEQWPEGPFDLTELSRLAAAERPLFPKPLPPRREKPADRRAILRCTPDCIPTPEELGSAALIMVELGEIAHPGRRPDLLEALAALGERAAALVSPSTTDEALIALRPHVASLVLEAERGGPAIDADSLARVHEAFDGPILLSLTRPEEIRSCFALARDERSVTGLIHSAGGDVSPRDEGSWDDLGAVLAAATALRIDAIQGLDDSMEHFFQRAFHAAHMGIRGQITRMATRVEELRRAYTPPRELIQEAAAIVERYYKAERIEQLGAIPYEFTYLQEKPSRGLVDAATAKIYDVVLNRAEELGLLDSEQREIWRSYTLRWVWNDSGEEVDFTRWRWSATDEQLIELRGDPGTRANLGGGPGQFSAAAET